VSSPIYTAALLVEGMRRRLPLVIQGRMVLNAAFDVLIGLVPLLGDLVDIGWKANLRNLALLERHQHPGVPPRRGDYLFVAVCLAALGLIALVPLLIIAWLIASVPRLF
jgi:hypothetical protein